MLIDNWSADCFSMTTEYNGTGMNNSWWMFNANVCGWLTNNDFWLMMDVGFWFSFYNLFRSIGDSWFRFVTITVDFVLMTVFNMMFLVVRLFYIFRFDDSTFNISIVTICRNRWNENCLSTILSENSETSFIL